VTPKLQTSRNKANEKRPVNSRQSWQGRGKKSVHRAKASKIMGWRGRTAKTEKERENSEKVGKGVKRGWRGTFKFASKTVVKRSPGYLAANKGTE